jgi:hypothetical protein
MGGLHGPLEQAQARYTRDARHVLSSAAEMEIMCLIATADSEREHDRRVPWSVEEAMGY